MRPRRARVCKVQLPDGYGAYTLAKGLDFCIATFSTEATALTFIRQHDVKEVLTVAISDFGELIDVAKRFKDDYKYFILDPGTKNGLIEISSLL